VMHHDAWDKTVNFRDFKLPHEGEYIVRVRAASRVPDRAEVLAEYRRYQLELPERVLHRLHACRSSLVIEDPGDLAESPLQVSLLRFLLERVGHGLIMFGDYPLEPTEQVLEELRTRHGAPGFDERPGAARGHRESRAQRETPHAPPTEVRAVRILELLKSAESSVELAIDVRDILSRASPLARRYAALIYEEGAIDDLKASRLLGVSADELEPEARALDARLRELLP